MNKWFSNLTPEAQAKIVVSVMAAQVLVNVFIMVGFILFIVKVLVA